MCILGGAVRWWIDKFSQNLVHLDFVEYVDLSSELSCIKLYKILENHIMNTLFDVSEAQVLLLELLISELMSNDLGHPWNFAG